MRKLLPKPLNPESHLRAHGHEVTVVELELLQGVQQEVRILFFQQLHQQVVEEVGLHLRVHQLFHLVHQEVQEQVELGYESEVGQGKHIWVEAGQ